VIVLVACLVLMWVVMTLGSIALIVESLPNGDHECTFGGIMILLTCIGIAAAVWSTPWS
jgi:hypothetical protein